MSKSYESSVLFHITLSTPSISLAPWWLSDEFPSGSSVAFRQPAARLRFQCTRRVFQQSCLNEHSKKRFLVLSLSLSKSQKKNLCLPRLLEDHSQGKRGEASTVPSNCEYTFLVLKSVEPQI